jgi:murein DD-endopeptidase MepM/ murein hydrolase activator NlpD
LQTATVVVQHLLERLRPDPTRARPRAAPPATRAGAHRAGSRRPLVPLAPLSWRRTLLERLGGPERLLPIAVAGLVLGASVLSVAPATGTASPTGGRAGSGSGPRLAIEPKYGESGEYGEPGAPAGELAGAPPPPEGGSLIDGPAGGVAGRSAEGVATDPAGGAPLTPVGPLGPVGPPRVDPGAASETPTPAPDGPYLADGTLLKPVAVDTSVPDGSAKLGRYRVRPGDTLTGIAGRFGVSMMTLWWANELKAKDALIVGQTLVIPPVSGLVVEVRDGDTLASLAAAAGASPDEIVAYNGLADRTLIIGQTLVIPGAHGEAIAEPTPRPEPPAASRPGAGGGGGGRGGGGSIRPPAQYEGGRLAFPVPGGYISQYFHPGHLAIDIAADYGTPVRAAAAGTVVYAGWKSNGGGYQVWLAHGSGLYTAYYHMSAITVGAGEHVGRGSQVGRIGMTGWATGPHCHFEVWLGGIDVGQRVNPLNYL